jgi:hypothetical protein
MPEPSGVPTGGTHGQVRIQVTLTQEVFNAQATAYKEGNSGWPFQGASPPKV